MTDNERDDMTDQDREQIVAGAGESPDVPVHPRPDAPQQPAGVVPPGGVPLEGGDLVDERRAAQEGNDTSGERTADVEDDPVADQTQNESDESE